MSRTTVKTGRWKDDCCGGGDVPRAVGVRRAIVSRWPVDDNATRHFMKAFFGAWTGTRSADAALKAARAYVRQHPRYGDPYYWAGFIAIGFT